MKKLIFLIVALFAANVQAVEYVSVGVMATDYNIPTPFDAVFDSNTVGAELAVGFPIVPTWLSLEVALSDNGQTEKTVGPVTNTIDSESLAVLLHGRVPIGPVTFHGRAGYSLTSFDFSGLNTTDMAPTFGIGLSHQLTAHWSIEADYLRRNHDIFNVPIRMDHAQLKGVYTF